MPLENEQTKPAVDMIVESAQTRAGLAELEKILAVREAALDIAAAQLRAAEEQLVALGLDKTKDWEPQIETLRIQAKAAEDAARRMIEDLGAGLGHARS